MAAVDNSGGTTGPATKAYAVTPSDSTDVPNTTRAVWVGGAGTLRVIMSGDTATVDLQGITAGSLIPIRVSRIYSTGTTATLIVGLY